MSEVLKLLSKSVEINSLLLNFVEYQPYQATKVQDPNSDNDSEMILDAPPTAGSFGSPTRFSPVFFNSVGFPLIGEQVHINQISHQIRLNQ